MLFFKLTSSLCILSDEEREEGGGGVRRGGNTVDHETDSLVLEETVPFSLSISLSLLYVPSHPLSSLLICLTDWLTSEGNVGVVCVRVCVRVCVCVVGGKGVHGSLAGFSS